MPNKQRVKLLFFVSYSRFDTGTACFSLTINSVNFNLKKFISPNWYKPSWFQPDSNFCKSDMYKPVCEKYFARVLSTYISFQLVKNGFKSIYIYSMWAFWLFIHILLYKESMFVIPTSNMKIMRGNFQHDIIIIFKGGQD